VFGEHIFETLLARRAWHEAEGRGMMRLIAPRGRAAPSKVRDLLERNLCRALCTTSTDAESADMLKRSGSRARKPGTRARA